MTTFHIDTAGLTVIATDEAGEHHDLNSTGEPCATTAELADFIRELHEQGAYDAETRDALLGECPTATRQILRYEVIEDNAGGLDLYVCDSSGAVVYAHTGYEYVLGQLRDDLQALTTATVDDISGWDGCTEDPQGDRDWYDKQEHDWQIVADETATYPDRMGAAATRELDTAAE